MESMKTDELTKKTKLDNTNRTEAQRKVRRTLKRETCDPHTKELIKKFQKLPGSIEIKNVFSS